MKKSLLITAFTAVAFFAFNQALQQATTALSLNETEKPISVDPTTNKALGISLWSSNFSTATEWTTGGNGAQGAWQIGVAANLPNPNYYSVITSTTASNGFAFFEGVQFLLQGSVNVQNSWIQMTNSIDCSSESVVTLKFEQEYRAFNYDKTYVEVSLDGGTTWVQTIDINPTITANSYATETVVYRNFIVNNSPTVKFRFRWESPNADNNYGSGYAWQVDDVNILTLSDHDIAIENYYYGTNGLFYHQIPLAQTAPIEGSAVLKNLGSQNQTNVVLTASESVNNVYTGTSTPVSLLSGNKDSVIVTTNFTPPAIGSYKMNYSISYNNTDDNPINNTVQPYEFTVGTSIYARDTSTQAEVGIRYGQMSGSTRNPPDAIEAGNVYDMVTTSLLTGIDFQFGNIISPGSSVFGEVYDENLNLLVNGETLPYQMVAGDEDSYKTLVFSSPLSLTAGQTYIVTVKSYDVDFSIATAGKSAPQTSFVYYINEATWYYTTSTPVVRMNFGPVVNTSKSTISGFTHIVGTPSVADSFNISGSNLTSNINVTAPTNFEIASSLAGPYGSNLTLTQTGGTIPPTKVYVRLNGPTANPNQTGNIVISTTGANNKMVALNGITKAECDIDNTVTVNGVVITANATGLSYQWVDCDNNTEIAGETGISYTATVNGNYAVILTDGPCVDSSNCIPITGVGLNDNDFTGVTIYPNPVNDVLKITNENGLLESVEIVTAAGRVVYTSKIASSEFEINVSNISSGVYFVNVRSAKNVKTFKVIK